MAVPMLTLFGQVANIFVQPGGTSRQTGEAYDPRDKVQILGHIPIQGGGSKLDLVTLNVEDATIFRDCVGKNIRVPIGVYSVGKTVGYFIPQGCEALIAQVPQ